jgi:hypothetical protein
MMSIPCELERQLLPTCQPATGGALYHKLFVVNCKYKAQNQYV